jgi:uncharacterized protein (TIGR02145 family)
MAELTPFTLTNDADGSTALAAGTTTSMTLAVTNRSGADIGLAAGTSQLVLGLPTAFFTAAQLTAMVVTARGWTGKAAADGKITVVCAEDITWAQAQTITVTIAQMRSDATPGTQMVHLTLSVPGNVSRNPTQPLTVTAPPSPSPLPLPLAASLSGGGVIYRSSASDPLVNTLVLTLKNTSNQVIRTARPGPEVSPPQVRISFVYGTSAGALAPVPAGSESPPADSATRIRAATAVGEADWGVTSVPVIDHGQPAWILTPADDNTALFGPATSDTANYSVEFSQIRSFNEPGPTQVIVLCTGFTRDATTRYSDLVLVLGLDKADPPPTRGLLAFGAPEAAVLTATQPGQSLPVRLRWTMYAGVARVRFLSSSPLVPSWDQRYPDPAPLGSDFADIAVPAPPQSQALFTTLQAFDGNGSFLNQAQFTIDIQVAYVTDRTGYVYPVLRYGSTLWMTADYRYDTGTGTSVYGGQALPAAPAGRLYEWATANGNAPDGWQLPSPDDWHALISDPAWAAQPFSALTSGGVAGFDAVLGGAWLASQYLGGGSTGYYWTSAAGGAMQFIKNPSPGAVVPMSNVAAGARLAVRYVRHL